MENPNRTSILKNNQIRWVRELINPGNEQAIGEERNAQHYISNIIGFEKDDNTISFHIENHNDVEGDAYEYSVTLNINDRSGQFRNTVADFDASIPSFEIFENENGIFIIGQWNENSGRESNNEIIIPNTSLRSWAENWIFWVRIEKPISEF